MFDPFDEEDEEEALYENGHWIWSDSQKRLVFEKDLSAEDDDLVSIAPAVFGKIEFKDDLDLIEQQRFRRRFQRKQEGDEDVIFLQDIKDIVLYTAPQSLLTPTVVNILHHPTTERFIRTLILYCQYYLQVADEMARRMLETDTKIRTPKSERVELILKDNVEDLRLLVAKEYVSMTIGHEMRKYHHMGPKKKSRSLSKKDITVFESILRISIQIVWLALERQSFNQIELEINRIFKSHFFNMVEHKLKTNYEAKMMPNERLVLIGHCARQEQKLTTRSPLINEMLCHGTTDFRLFGIATVNFPTMTSRLRYLEQTLTMSERLFQNNNIVLGILGLHRNRFDTMLREIKMVASSTSSSASIRSRSVSRTSRSSMKKSTVGRTKIFGDIKLPPKTSYEKEWLPDSFPDQGLPLRYCNPLQRLKWLVRAARIGNKRFSAMRQLHQLKPMHSMHTTKLHR